MKYNLYKIIILPLLILLLATAAKIKEQNNSLELDGLDKVRKVHRYFPVVASELKNYKRGIPLHKSSTSVATVEGIAKSYLRDHSTILGTESVDRELDLEQVIESPGGKHVLFQGSLNGIPIYNSNVVITLNKHSQVTFVASNFYPKIHLDSSAPSLSVSSAISEAKVHLGLTGKILCPVKSELIIFPSREWGALLTYRIQICTDIPRGDWELFVDAHNGKIVHVRNRIIYRNGQGTVWDPDPLRSAMMFYGGEYLDNDDADAESLNNSRIEVLLKDLVYEDGLYRLEGPNVKLVDIEAPLDTFPRFADSSDFVFTRQQQGFESVMLYYHIDKARRRLIDLGYNLAGLDSFKVDPHGVLNEFGESLDQSYYSPTGNFCVFGEGGVDDAEDATVIWHEYGHAIQENITPHMYYYDETAAVQEGSADYWAASYLNAITEFVPGRLFLWDGGITSVADDSGTFWPGRRCDLALVYPDDYVRDFKHRHYNGQIWSSALMNIWQSLGREITDNLFLQACYIWGSSPGLRDAALAFIEADRLLYQGIHLTTIFQLLELHGLVNSDSYAINIEHTPLRDTEDIYGPYNIVAKIIPGLAMLDSNQLWIKWGTEGSFIDSVMLKPSGSVNEYRAQIIGPGEVGIINYFISAQDTNGFLKTHPDDAPINSHRFFAGPDTVHPTIDHIVLQNQTIVRWPAMISARVEDNIGISSVEVRYFVNDSSNIESSYLQKSSVDNWYAGVFNLDTTKLRIGDSIFYKIIAKDISAVKNQTTHPLEGYHGFEIIDGGGKIVFDFEMDANGFIGQGEWQWGPPTSGPSGAHGGDNLWATRLHENYSENELESTLMLPDISLMTFSHATLDFWHWYDIEPGYDGGNVKVSNDSGITWQVIYPIYGYDDTIATEFGNPLAGEWAFTGKSNMWRQCHFNLDRYVGQVIKIKLDFGSDISKSASGWYIDDVVISDDESILKAPVGLIVADNRGYVRLAWDKIAKNTRQDKSERENKSLSEKLTSNILINTRGIEKDINNTYDLTGAISYRIYKSTDSKSFKLLDSVWVESYTDSVVIPGNRYDYYITTMVWHGESVPSDTVYTIVEPITEISAINKIPRHFDLEQNYPNPFNPVTTIKYQLAKGSPVKLEIFNILGEKVATLVDTYQNADYYKVNWNVNQRLASGVYFYRIIANNFIKIRKSILLR